MDVFQAVLCGILGTTFAAASVIWEMERWSIAKQTGIYFLITALVMLPIAYFAQWMERSIVGFLVYFGLFLVIFLVMWVVMHFVWRNRIKRLNAHVEAQR
jgi:hypothetical protein